MNEKLPAALFWLGLVLIFAPLALFCLALAVFVAPWLGMVLAIVVAARAAKHFAEKKS